MDRDAAPELGAVVLTGGTAARMDGADKAAIDLGGATLLERALAATVAATEIVVVGDQVPTSRPVTWTREEPRHGGPAAGLLAALDRLHPCPFVAVLAVDMPRATPGTFARLREAVAPEVDGAVLVDDAGARQPLCAVYRWTALESARPLDRGQEHGLSMRRLLAPLRLVEVPAVGDEARDVDTWSDLRALRETVAGARRTGDPA